MRDAMTQNIEATRIAELEADNRRLRLLLDKQDAPGELRHRLNNTLAMLRVIIQKSAETKRDLSAYVGHLEDRLEELARAQAAADEAGVVDLHVLLADELLHYQATEDEQVTLSGPRILLRPRAGQVLALAIHELAVNAIEHGALGANAGTVGVGWTTTPSPIPTLTIIWKEAGPTAQAKGRHQGFGIEVLTQTIAYELKASTRLAFEPDGLRYEVSFPLSPQVGEVWPDETASPSL